MMKNIHTRVENVVLILNEVEARELLGILRGNPMPRTTRRLEKITRILTDAMDTRNEVVKLAAEGKQTEEGQSDDNRHAKRL